jgi:chromosomal replication initiation ATPase DnaA
MKRKLFEINKRFETQEAQAIRVEISNIFDVDANFHEIRLKTSAYSMARMVYMVMLRNYIGGSLKEIGHHCGRRDHSTVLHALHTIERDRSFDKKLALKLEKLEQFSEAIVSGFYSAAGMMAVAFAKKSGNEVEGWL